MYEINIFFINNKFQYKKTKFNLHSDFYDIEIKNNNFKINNNNEVFSKINYSLANYDKDLCDFFCLMESIGIICVNIDFLRFNLNIL